MIGTDPFTAPVSGSNRLGWGVRSLAWGVVGTVLLAAPAAAQDGSSPMTDLGDAICGTGLGQLIVLGLAAISLYLIIKGGARLAMALDKLGSARSDKQQEGREQLVGGGKTMVGALVPPVFGAVLDIVGINTISCITFTDLGIVGVVVVPL